MIKFVVILVVVLLALLFGHNLMDVDGRIIIDISGTIIQMELLAGFIFLILFALALMVLVWALKKIVRAVSGSRNWLGAFSRRQQTNAYYQSINAMLLNEPSSALKQIRKTLGGDFHGSNYLIAAELESQANNPKQAKAYLIQAMEHPKSEAIAMFKQAELALNNNAAEDAMELLNNIEAPLRKTRPFVLLKLRILAALNDWSSIQELTKQNKKLLAEDYTVWAEQCVRGEFAAIASKDGANALKTHWNNLGRSQRHDEANQIAYLKLLIEQGLYADAESELINFARRQPSPLFWPLFKLLRMPNPAKSIKFIEGEIKKSPQDYRLYSVLAHLAYNSQDLALAQKALKKSLELKPTREDKRLLAQILEDTNDYAAANQVYHGLLDKTE